LLTSQARKIFILRRRAVQHPWRRPGDFPIFFVGGGYLKIVLDWLERLAALPFLFLLVVVALGSIVVIARSMEERELRREARVARLGGYGYLFLAAALYLVSRAAALFFP